MAAAVRKAKKVVADAESKANEETASAEKMSKEEIATAEKNAVAATDDKAKKQSLPLKKKPM